MFANLTGWHALIVLAIVLLVFGASKLPALARSLGQSVRILKEESQSDDAGAEALSVESASAAEAPVAITRASSAPSWTDAEIAAVRPGQRFVVVGGSAHLSRIAIADLAEDDPVRRAAEADDPALAV